MRRWLVVALLLLLSAPALADAPPSLDEAFAQADAEHQPLVVELTAEWCAPCRYFEQKVLPLANVKAELEHVVFVRYDFDTEPGITIAQRYDITSVPAFLTFDHGVLTHRFLGLAGRSGDEWRSFLGVLRAAGSADLARADLATLEADVASNPDDATKRMRLARAYRALHRTDDSTEQYTWIIEHELDHATAARAMGERDEMQHAHQSVQRALASASELVRMYPESELASFRIALMAVSNDPPSDLADLVRAHLKLVPLVHWPDAVRAALVAGQLDAARASVFERLDPKRDLPLARLVQAEVAIVAHDPALAREAIDHACHDSYGLWCFVLEQTLDSGGKEPPTIHRLRAHAQAYLAGLEQPDRALDEDHGIDRLLETAPALGDALALSLRTARYVCEPKAKRGGPMFVAVDLAPSGRLRSVRVQSREGGALDRCIEKQLRELPLPTAPEGLDNHVHAQMAVHAPDRLKQLLAPLPGGIVAGPSARFGEVQTFGFASRFVVGLTPIIAVGGQLELAGGDSKHPAYAARALTGLHAKCPWIACEGLVLIGGGASDLGKGSPAQLEYAFEGRLISRVGPARIHTWLDMGNAVGWGAGVSLPFGDVRIMFGAEYEQRAVGTSTVFSIGFPVGELY